MKEVQIGRKHDGTTVIPLSRLDRAVKLTGAIEQAQKQGARLYSLDMQELSGRYSVTTGSKEIFLLFGRMGPVAQRALLELIDSETRETGQLLVSFHHEGFVMGFICAVSRRAAPDPVVSIVLSQAHSRKDKDD